MIDMAYIENFVNHVSLLENSGKPVCKVSLYIDVDGDEVLIDKAPGFWVLPDSNDFNGCEDPYICPNFESFPLLESVWFDTFVDSGKGYEPKCDF